MLDGVFTGVLRSVIHLLAASGMFIAVSTGGCHEAGPIVEMWISQQAPHRDRSPGSQTPPKTDLAGPARVELAGAVNETLSFAFAVRPGTTLIEKPGFRLSPFNSVESTIDSSALTLFRMHPVTIDSWPGWHLRSTAPCDRDPHPLDVLVPIRAPRGGLPAQMQPGATYHFWVDVAIPKGTASGTYVTSLELVANDTSLGGVQVHLEVWPFLLPDENTIPLIAELDHRRLFSHHVSYHGRPLHLSVDDWRDDPRRSDLDALLNSTMRMLRKHRVTPVLPELTPIVKATAREGVTIDWGQYDAVVERCMSGRAFFSRVPLEVWPMPLRTVVVPGQDDGLLLSPSHARLLRDYAAACAAHFEEKGWLKRSYALASAATLPSIEAAEAVTQFASIVSQAGGRIPILSRLFPQNLRAYGWVDMPSLDLGDSVDIWMPYAQFFDIEAMAGMRGAGRQTWLAVDRPPYSGTLAVHGHQADVRVLSWQAEQLGAQAVFAGCINRWPPAEENPAPSDCVSADPNVLLYPGGPYGLYEPVASVRLKLLRRSMQDAAYSGLLSDHGLAHVGEAMRSSLAPYAGSEAYRTHFADGRPIGWAQDTNLYDDALKTMAEQLIRRTYDDPAGPQASALSAGTTWRRLITHTRDLKVYVDGTRVRLSGTRASPVLELECALTIANGTRTPVAGSVRFTGLPEDWPLPDDRRIATIPPNGSRRVKVTGQAITMPALPGGAFELPLELAIDDGMVHHLQARMSIVTAIPAPESIRIDGDLSDWPSGTINVASDFLLINPAKPGESARAHRTPTHKTFAFVLRDANSLYIAVNCEADPNLRASAIRSKNVRYDDMIPLDEELIEVLIDPLNAGTRSPEDLYHIVIKRTGTDLTEKGIDFDPPCGARGPWPVDLDVATHITDGRWMAEMRIPLDAFGTVGTDHAVWGFNLTRFDAATQEFSTWSGAVGNAYDPLSLGNLCLP